MVSLGELLAEDGFKNREPRPRVKLSHASGATMSMPPLHHVHGTNLLCPSANPSRLGEGKTRSSKSLPRRTIPAIGCKEDISDQMPGFGGGGGKKINARHGKRLQLAHMEDAGVGPPLDAAATRALISILVDYVSCFFKNGNFRMLLRQKCYYCLRFAESGENIQNDGGVAAKIRDAIATIERSVQEFPDPKDLNKSCAQLSSSITGLSSTDLKGGFSPGIPGSRLSACAHLYLSVVYKMMKKDRACAEHLLQVFCDCPFEARTILLPDLWESLLLPHLRHLTEWHVEEREGISGSPCREIKIKLLERVYSDALDEGTYQIAAYYEDWVMGGVEAPSYPSICFPSPSFFGTSQGGNSQVPASPCSSAFSRPQISRKLYESIFSRSKGKGVNSINEQDDGEAWDDKLCRDCRSNSCGRDVEADETGHYSSRLMMHREERRHENGPMNSSMY